MGILIKGMEIPVSCGECLKIGWNYVFECNIDDVEDGEKLNTCPLIPVPPHYGRLIDGDELEQQMVSRKNYVGRLSDPLCLVQDAPTIIEAEKEENNDWGRAFCF